ncbi:hypothetical protein [Nonomuraea lactucae]|uniref:hypothetical protein n=1 Tax=Nonomuraea lactucae TaxID=2249762 RepID=UPI0013B4249D|nr:hypothetical protein [Nonomuraea lactucae]
MRPSLSRRAVLAGGAAAAALTGCSGPTTGPEHPATPPEPPERLLARQLMADKEHLIGLYAALIAKGATKLAPFRDRHQAHLTELRRRFPGVTPSPAPPSSGAPGSPQPAAPSPGAPQSAGPSAGPSQGTAAAPVVSLSRLRSLERRAAALRPRQLASASPAFAQLIASIGACEAAHAVALPRSL